MKPNRVCGWCCGGLAVVALFLGLVWVFSAVSYYGYELPANRWVRALLGTAARP